MLGNKRMNKLFYLPSRNSKSGRDWARKTTVGELEDSPSSVSFSFPAVCLYYLALFKNTSTTINGKQKCYQQEISKRSKANGYKLTEKTEEPQPEKKKDGNPRGGSSSRGLQAESMVPRALMARNYGITSEFLSQPLPSLPPNPPRPTGADDPRTKQGQSKDSVPSW